MQSKKNKSLILALFSAIILGISAVFISVLSVQQGMFNSKSYSEFKKGIPQKVELQNNISCEKSSFSITISLGEVLYVCQTAGTYLTSLDLDNNKATYVTTNSDLVTVNATPVSVDIKSVSY